MPLPRNEAPRIQIQAVEPIVDCGRYPVKATVGDQVEVNATVLKDGHDTLAGSVRVRGPGERRFAEVPLLPLGNDRYGGRFTVDKLSLDYTTVFLSVEQDGSVIGTTATATIDPDTGDALLDLSM